MFPLILGAPLATLLWPAYVSTHDASTCLGRSWQVLARGSALPGFMAPLTHGLQSSDRPIFNRRGVRELACMLIAADRHGVMGAGVSAVVFHRPFQQQSFGVVACIHD